MVRKNLFTSGLLALLVAGGAYGTAGCGSVAATDDGGVVQAAAAHATTAGFGPATAGAAEAAPAPKATYAAFAGAAERNAKLSREVEWHFGGRTQRGWALHGLLVGRLVGTDAEPETPEFASAVAAWQKANGVAPADGVVTRDCWLKMMKALQAARTFDAVTPPSSELVQVDASEWWDRQRPAALRHLRRDAYDAYRRMVAAARADLGSEADGYFQIVSGHRSPEYQAALRARAGNPSTAALAVRSPHFTGRAIDIYVGGDPVSTADANRAVQVETPAFRWLARNAHRFGFRPYFYEPWHWEYDPRLAR